MHGWRGLVSCTIFSNAGCLPPEVALRREVSHVQRLLATVNESAERAGISKRRDYLMMRLDISRGSAAGLCVEQISRKDRAGA